MNAPLAPQNSDLVTLDPQAEPFKAPADATPVMAQYFEAKHAQPHALLFFRMGDFYELFFDDAVKAAEALGIALTRRGKHGGEEIPMAGVPFHAAEGYIAKLIRLGFKVAVCEQMEDPAEAKKRGYKAVVRREVVRVVTPGTLTEDSLLDARGANRLCAISVRGDKAAVASVELSTGDVESLFVARGDLSAALSALRPSETLSPDRLFADEEINQALKLCGGVVQPMASALADPSAASARLKRLYGTLTLDGFGDFHAVELSALGLLAAYIETTQAGKLPSLKPPRRGGEEGFMAIDPATRNSLEIDRSSQGGRDGSLLAAIDRTVTSGGARLLASRLSRPLLDPLKIQDRLDAVEWLLGERRLREDMRQELKGAGDMARALSRLVLGRGGPRDLGILRDALAAGERICGRFGLLGHSASEVLEGHGFGVEIEGALKDLTPSPELQAFNQDLLAALEIELPGMARDGGFVVRGFRPDLDETRALRDDSRRVIVQMEADYQARSGVAVKIKHNAVLGYFIETTAKQADALMAPPLNTLFIHRQTLANQVRFTTSDLAELDAKISQAGDRALAMEIETFEVFKARAVELSTEIQAAADALAKLDVASANATLAEEVEAVRPEITADLSFEVEGGRHPVVEAAVKKDGGVFTPNDCRLDGSGQGAARLAIVTGPNMAGKSTFLRQNALLSVLAQTGLFVPARRFKLGVVDRLFSRVGAGDDLARGRSTFMMEMVETAAILTQATARSFVVLDEIGRGTATYDGLAIAWACAEALHDVNKARTLFATHYHEMAVLEERLAHCTNLSLHAKEWNGELVFMHEARVGAADRSYGVQVARLAGVPHAVVSRAKEVLERLETEGAAPARLEDLPLFAAVHHAPPPVVKESAVESLLKDIDPDSLSPREALEALYRLKAVQV